MRRRVLFFILLAVCSLEAQIVDRKQLEIDFTDAAKASAKASWPESDANVTSLGLAWNGKATSSQYVWFLTEPVPLGLSWRTPSAALIMGKIFPGLEDTEDRKGEVQSWGLGQLFVRYGPDCQKWTPWQALQADEDLLRKKGELIFKGLVEIPNRDREAYEKLLLEYMRKDDVPWGSDEDAAVRWILAKEPDFFERAIPFMGYVQFLFENRFGGHRHIKAFSADITYGMSGRSTIPKDQSRYPAMGSSWGYKSKPKSSP